MSSPAYASIKFLPNTRLSESEDTAVAPIHRTLPIPLPYKLLQRCKNPKAQAPKYPPAPSTATFCLSKGTAAEPRGFAASDDDEGLTESERQGLFKNNNSSRILLTTVQSTLRERRKKEVVMAEQQRVRKKRVEANLSILLPMTKSSRTSHIENVAS